MRFFSLCLGALLFAALLQAQPHFPEPVSTPSIVDVFVNGRDGYTVYRIPSLVTTRHGTLLAFAEGRASQKDHAKNDIVLKWSTDGGRTWSPLQVINDDGDICLSNPT